MDIETKTTSESGPAYTVRAVAERVGVPTPTLRSWNRRYGIGPQQHEPGRHRTYTETDIVVVQRMVELIAGGASPASAAATARTVRRRPSSDLGDIEPLVKAAHRLDSVELLQLLTDHFEVHGVVRTWERLCRPTFAEIVRLQTSTGGCVDVEHVLSWAVITSLHRIPHPQSPSVVLLACAQDELHTMPLEVLRAALAERDVSALVLGSVPSDAVADALTRAPATGAVVLWASSSSTVDRRALHTAGSTGARVFVSGPGWSDGNTEDAATFVATLPDAIDRLASFALSLVGS